MPSVIPCVSVCIIAVALLISSGIWFAILLAKLINSSAAQDRISGSIPIMPLSRAVIMLAAPDVRALEFFEMPPTKDCTRETAAFATLGANCAAFVTISPRIFPASATRPSRPPFLNASVSCPTYSVACSAASFNGSAMPSYSSMPRPSREDFRIVTAPFRLSFMVSAMLAAAPSASEIALCTFVISFGAAFINARKPDIAFLPTSASAFADFSASVI